MMLDPAGYEDLYGNDDNLLEVLMDLHAAVSILRYLLSRTTSAGRHPIDTWNGSIFNFPDRIFQMLFRMQRESFWKLVEILEVYWQGSSDQATIADTTDIIMPDNTDVIMSSTAASYQRQYNLRSRSNRTTPGRAREIYEQVVVA